MDEEYGGERRVVSGGEEPARRMTRRAFLGGAAALGITGVAAATFAAYEWQNGQDMQPRISGNIGIGGSSTKRVIFVHQSTGADIVKDGNLRDLLRHQAPAIELWDYAYNPPSLRTLVRSAVKRQSLMPDHYYGLRDGNGRSVAGSLDIPGDNTSPEAWAAIFAQPVTTPPSNAFSTMLRFDAIAFKSCFTIFPIRSDGQLERYKAAYRAVRGVIDQHPGTLFLPLTPPPLRASLTTPDEAARARQYARWIMSREFHGDRPNVMPFDLFDALAAPEGTPQANMLRPEFSREDLNDSHPSPEANKLIATQWATFLARIAERAASLRESVAAQ